MHIYIYIYCTRGTNTHEIVPLKRHEFMTYTVREAFQKPFERKWRASSRQRHVGAALTCAGFFCARSSGRHEQHERHERNITTWHVLGFVALK